MPPDLPRRYICYRVQGPIGIDGNLDKWPWTDVQWTEEFRDIEGDHLPAPPLQTRVKLLWDDRYLYIGAQLFDPHVWGTLTEHDSVIFQDNDFEIFIDPDWDNHNYYEIEINALNTVWDLRMVKPYRDGGPALNSWEIPGLVSAVKIDGTINDPSDKDRSWSVELAVPWDALAEFANRPSPPHDTDQWRMNFSRVHWDTVVENGAYVKVPNRPEHNWAWSPQGAVDMHRPECWGYVQFSTQPVGAAQFVPDSSSPARHALMLVYHAQRRHHEATGRYAGSSAQLEGLWQPAQYPIEITLAPDGYRAVTSFDDSSGNRFAVCLEQDSHIWVVPPPGPPGGRLSSVHLR